MRFIRYLQCILWLALTSTAIFAAASAIPRDGRREPQRVTWFGERPAFSPNSSSFAFMSKSYGDALSYDLSTGHITLITHYPNSGYLRAQYLPNGDLFLIGAREFEDYATTREEDMEMWILQPGSLDPVALGHKIFEGVAISYQNNHISWANTHPQYPDLIAEDETIIYEADIIYNATGYPSLGRKREVIRTYSPECVAEPQDFRHDDSELIYTCYRITDESRVGDIRSINLDDGIVTIYRNVSEEYNEVEGIYPGGEYTTVESAHDQAQPDDNYGIEIWRMKLVPNSQDFVRLTWLTDVPGDKAGNPVVSPDGKYMAFSLGKALDNPPGAGYGIFLLELDPV